MHSTIMAKRLHCITPHSHKHSGRKWLAERLENRTNSQRLPKPVANWRLSCRPNPRYIYVRFDDYSAQNHAIFPSVQRGICTTVLCITHNKAWLNNLLNRIYQQRNSDHTTKLPVVAQRYSNFKFAKNYASSRPLSASQKEQQELTAHLEGRSVRHRAAGKIVRPAAGSGSQSSGIKHARRTSWVAISEKQKTLFL